MNLLIIIFILVVKVTTVNADDSLREAEFKKIEETYKLTNASRGKDAVKEAIEFVLSQKDITKELQERKRNRNISEDTFNTIEPNLFCDNHIKGLCPFCNLTMDSIIDDGRFIYLSNTTSPPYSHRCWSMMIRYHAAPECEKEEASRGLAPIWKWKWTVKDAENKQCILPPSFPPLAMDQYAKLNNIKKDKDQPFIVFMMGLSFMGQPFQALGCLYEEYVSGGTTYLDNGPVNISEIRANNGQCTGYKLSDIMKYYPKELHPGIDLPKQNLEFCGMGSAMIKFKYKNYREVHVCYTYIFNVQKNFPPGSKLPCEIQWKDIDVGISILGKGELFQYVQNTGGVLSQLSHLKLIIVHTIYEGMIEDQLNAAYKKHGFGYLERADYRAKFEKCGKTDSDSDVHYRLPGYHLILLSCLSSSWLSSSSSSSLGLPDYAVKIWFSYIATGLLSGMKEYGGVKYVGGKTCKSPNNPNVEWEC